MPASTGPQAKKPSQTGRAVFILLGLIALAWFIAYLSSHNSSPSASPPHASKTLDVAVAWSMVSVQITNKGSDEAVGRTMTVYLNGTPPFAYQTEARLPPIGRSVTIPLMTFVKSGERFNPLNQAPYVVWVGGGGYDYASFGK